MQFRIWAIIAFTLISGTPLFSQDTYPKITAYTSVLHPLITINHKEAVPNFRDYYLVIFPSGINIWKNSKMAFSVEFAPSIKVEKGMSKMSNFLFHPGILIALGKGFTFAGRAAFETSGRYGFTPVFGKTVIKKKKHGFYVATPFPVRFGNDQPASFTAGLQLGISF
ncbi:hypothetical protein [Niabella sp.]|uniref:hypothetical protein n=1 Tax=Niabella sp. TaxID=1962976 RepID=UPI00260E68A2|nr:hypothetical protein [Niabella sp.]